jgi:protein TonB
VIYAVQRASLGAANPDTWDATNVLEIKAESDLVATASASSVSLPIKEVPVSRPRETPAKEVVQEVCVTESLLSLWTQEQPHPAGVFKPISSVSSTIVPSVVRQEAIAETGGRENSAGVESGAQYLFNPKPVYPAESRKRKEQGTVILEVWVDVQGVPKEVVIKQSAGYRHLDEAALEAVKQWRFEPAQRNNVKIVSRVEIPVRFELLNSL